MSGFAMAGVSGQLGMRLVQRIPVVILLWINLLLNNLDPQILDMRFSNSGI